MGENRPMLAPGTTTVAGCVVGEADLASRLGGEPGDEYPDVFATTRMIALMEVAASRALRPLLRPGEMSVGVGVDVRHAAPTPPGAGVRATARFTGMDGKLYVFDVVAEDEAGEIGSGRHTRAIVETARLLAGAARRRAP
jgi:fluoroacetyl-CoA thioesterase